MNNLRFNPTRLPNELYRTMAHYLDEQGLAALSLVSRGNYLAIYKIGVETLLTCYKSEGLPDRRLCLQIFFEKAFVKRHSPYYNRLFISANKDDLKLLHKRNRNISFASHPRHKHFIATLNQSFPERITYVEQIEKEAAPLAERYQTWLREEVFVGSTGLDSDVFLENICQLIRTYQENPNRSILQMLKNAQVVFPSESLMQIVDLLEKNPQAQIFEHPTFSAFQEAVNRALYVQHIALHANEIENVISDGLDGLDQLRSGGGRANNLFRDRYLAWIAVFSSR